MTRKDRAVLALSKTRSAINTLLDIEPDKRTEEQRAELPTLTARAEEQAAEERAAIVAEAPAVETREETVDAEERERRSLSRSARVGAFIASAITGASLDGREAEAAAAFGCPGRLPLALFDVDRPPVGGTRDHSGRHVCADGGAHRAVRFRAVRRGFARVPNAHGGARSGELPRDRNRRSRGRRQQGGQPRWRRPPRSGSTRGFRNESPASSRSASEDMALFPDMERSLRESLTDSMSNALDEAVFTATGTAGTLEGLFEQAANQGAASAVETFNTGVARFAALVDGQYSYGWRDIRTVIGSATFAKYASAVREHGQLLGLAVGLPLQHARVDPGEQPGSGRRRHGAEGRSSRLNAPMQPLRIPTWMGVEIIVDIYSKAGQGIKVCTATTLVGDPHLPYGQSQLKELHPKLSVGADRWPGFCYRGPAGGGKSGRAETLLEEMRLKHGTSIIVDFQKLYVAVSAVRRRKKDGRYPDRGDGDGLLPIVEWLRQRSIGESVSRDIFVIATNSDGNPARRQYLMSLLGIDATEEVLDPGRDVVEERLSVDGELAPGCEQAINRWYSRLV